MQTSFPKSPRLQQDLRFWISGLGLSPNAPRMIWGFSGVTVGFGGEGNGSHYVGLRALASIKGGAGFF